jgi:hypothetical protein
VGERGKQQGGWFGAVMWGPRAGFLFWFWTRRPMAGEGLNTYLTSGQFGRYSLYRLSKLRPIWPKHHKLAYSQRPTAVSLLGPFSVIPRCSCAQSPAEMYLHIMTVPKCCKTYPGTHTRGPAFSTWPETRSNSQRPCGQWPEEGTDIKVFCGQPWPIETLQQGRSAA